MPNEKELIEKLRRIFEGAHLEKLEIIKGEFFFTFKDPIGDIVNLKLEGTIIIKNTSSVAVELIAGINAYTDL